MTHERCADDAQEVRVTFAGERSGTSEFGTWEIPNLCVWVRKQGSVRVQHFLTHTENTQCSRLGSQHHAWLHGSAGFWAKTIFWRSRVQFPLQPGTSLLSLCDMALEVA